MDPINEFMTNIFIYLTCQRIYNQNYNVIRKHIEKLSQLGDFSFPIGLHVWRPYLPTENIKNDSGNIFTYSHIATSTDAESLEENVKEKINKLMAISQEWILPIRLMKIENERCVVYINRNDAFRNVMKMYLVPENISYAKTAIVRNVYISSDAGPPNNENLTVTDYRLQLINKIVKNLVQRSSKYQLVSNSDQADIKVHLTTKSNTKVDVDVIKILCGIVSDPRNGNKLAQVQYDDYLKTRTIDMQLMAQHKYGVRVKNEQIFINLIQNLGHAAVSVDFLEIKHTNPANLNIIGAGHSASKGAPFILYNSARIETLFRLFEERIEKGILPALPDFKDIDVSLLKEEEEWQLFFNFIVNFQWTINRAIDDLSNNGKISPHLICSFLNHLVGTFSIYYRRVRILTEYRPQLLPVMQSRLYLLKCLRNIFNSMLDILDISPVTQM